MNELENSKQGGRAANVWMALTTRALKSLPAESQSLPASEVTESPQRANRNGRVEKVVSKVFSILSPLVSPSQNEGLRRDLITLANQAIDVWDEAQTGELKITVNPLLEQQHREAWRSQRFDPAPSSTDYDKTKIDGGTETRPRVFTLFPRVVANGVTSPTKADRGPPGGWPSESDQVNHKIEMCIHPGLGLPEWSPLVLRGKEEQECLQKLIEDARKEAHSARRRTSRHSRVDSTGSLASGPSSPSSQWKMVGVMKLPEK